jgi:hypothetical protein
MLSDVVGSVLSALVLIQPGGNAIWAAMGSSKLVDGHIVHKLLGNRIVGKAKPTGLERGRPFCPLRRVRVKIRVVVPTSTQSWYITHMLAPGDTGLNPGRAQDISLRLPWIAFNAPA